MAQNWHYSKADEKFGPVSVAELKKLASSGELQPTDLVWREGLKEWKKASSLKGLFPKSPPVPTTPPLPTSLSPPTSSPPQLPNQDVKQKWYEKKKFKIVIITIGAFAAISGGVRGCRESGESINIELVKNGHLQNYPQVTVGNAFDSFLGSPQWTALTGDDGNHYVNVKGNMTYMEKPVTGLVQFQVFPESKRFDLRAFEINGVPQNGLMQVGLIEKVYEEYEE